MKNKYIFLLLSGLFIAVVGYFGMRIVNKRSYQVPTGHKLTVVASFYPLYYFAQQIGNGKATVTNLTPAGAEPHDFEPNTQDISRIQNARMLVVNGAGFEPWADKLNDDVKNKQLKVVILAERLANQHIEEDGKQVRDPHVWLDPVLAKQEVEKIKQAYLDIDPANKDTYVANTNALEDKLDALDQSFQKGLADCKQKNIVTSHAAFGYVASRYGLKQIAISGINPDAEPSPQQLAAVAGIAQKAGIKYIFFETLVSPRLAETIAKEVGAQTLVFNPLEGLSPEEEAAGHDYFSVQNENLAHLKVALECQ